MPAFPGSGSHTPFAAVKQIPTRRALAGPLLAAAAASSQTRMLGQVKAQLCGALRGTLTCDGYERQDRVHVMGSIVGALGFRYVLEAKDE